MGKVIEWADVLVRYPELDKLPTIGAVSDNVIASAEARVHSRLASRYTVPFSSNNLAAADLVIDMVYIQTQMTRQPEKATALREDVDSRISALLDGTSQMALDDGTVLAAVGDTVWSNTGDYHPTFGMSDPIVQEIDSAMLIAENYDRGSQVDEAL